jgi:hypothetical protein
MNRYDDKWGDGMPRTRKLQAGGLVLLLGFAGLVTASAAQAASVAHPAAASGWKIEKTPSPAGVPFSGLGSVSCTSATACTAAGSYSTNSGGGTLAERWNGKTWSIQSTVTPKGTNGNGFHGVSCTSSTACMAVGTAFVTATSANRPLAESWNGKNWRAQTTPSPKGGSGGVFFADSCTAASACTAVGDFVTKAGLQRGLIERWNGKSWTVQAGAAAAKQVWLMGVSCPAADACVADGYQNNGTGDAQLLIERWNGKSWTAQQVPLPKGAPGGAFSAVSCTSPTACTATGTDFGVTAPSLAERWNGKTWKVQRTPNPSNYKTSFSSIALNGVSCTSATACTATGAYTPGGSGAYFTEVWNGKTWKLQSPPEPAGFVSGALLGVSCVPGRCTATGAYIASSGPQLTLAMAN